MIVVPLHAHFSPERLERVTAEMRRRGPPRIRAFHDIESGAWLSLEGTHRLRAASALGLVPVMVSVRWPRSQAALVRARYAIARRGHTFPDVEGFRQAFDIAAAEAQHWQHRAMHYRRQRNLMRIALKCFMRELDHLAGVVERLHVWASDDVAPAREALPAHGDQAGRSADAVDD